MRKFTALGFAVCGTLLAVLLFIAGRMLYIQLYHQSLSDIAGGRTHETLALAENATALPAVTGEEQVTPYLDLLGSYTYTPYPDFIQPAEDRLAANRLTVTFANGRSIGVNADGYIFIDGNLSGIKEDRGQELYHKLYMLFYPSAS